MSPHKQHHSAGHAWLHRLTSRLTSGPALTAAALVAWEILVRLAEVRPTFLPSPSRVLLELWRQTPQFRRHAAVTLFESMEGLLLAGIAGIVLGGLVALWSPLRRITGTVLRVLSLVPVITLAPLMIIWYGYGFPSAAANSFIVCFLPLFSFLVAGFGSLPPETEEILLAMGVSRASFCGKVRLHACLPYLTAGLKLSVPLAFAGATVAEFVGSDSGLGFLMQYAGSMADATPLFTALALLVAMILCLNLMLTFIERNWIAWPVALPARLDVFPGVATKGSSAGRAE